MASTSLPDLSPHLTDHELAWPVNRFPVENDRSHKLPSAQNAPANGERPTTATIGKLDPTPKVKQAGQSDLSELARFATGFCFTSDAI